MKNQHLLSCPFCGNKLVKKKHKDACGNPWFDYWVHKRNDCILGMQDSFIVFEHQIAEWNRRANDE